MVGRSFAILRLPHRSDASLRLRIWPFAHFLVKITKLNHVRRHIIYGRLGDVCDVRLCQCDKSNLAIWIEFDAPMQCDVMCDSVDNAELTMAYIMFIMWIACRQTNDCDTSFDLAFNTQPMPNGTTFFFLLLLVVVDVGMVALLLPVLTMMMIDVEHWHSAKDES